MTLPPPSALLGIPKYSSWYPNQDKNLARMTHWFHSDKRFIGVAIPSGQGKSISALLLAKLSGARTVILTESKGLQQQYLEDCSQLGGCLMMGRPNYDCLLVRGAKADEGPCRLGVSCSLKSDCPYQVQLQKALSANIVVTNYAYWLAQTNYASGLGDVGLLVCDEANQAFNALEGFLSLYITEYDLKSCSITFPSSSALSILSPTDQWPVWKAWADSVLPTAKDYLALTESKVKISKSTNGAPDHYLLQKLKVAKRAVSSLERIKTIDSNWVVQRFPHSVKFTPIWVAGYSSSLFHSVPKVMLMSATLSQKTADSLGVPADRDWLEVGSSFPASNTPVWHVPSARINFRTDDYGSTIWAARIDQIISRRLDRKGIIFTVSYARAKMLLERSRFKDIMVSHGSDNVFQVVSRFKEMPSPAVLVSPTVTTGWDFPGLGGYIVVGKVPYPDTSDPVMKARSATDKSWSSYLAMGTVAQESARMSRSSTDKCEVMVLDDAWRWFYYKYKEFAPKWFQARVKGSLTCVPSPLI